MNKKTAFSLLELSIIIIAVALVIAIVKTVHHEIKLNDKDNAINVSCLLLEKSYKGSTLKSNAVPIVGAGMNGGVVGGIGVSTSGESEQFITIFDCGKYGNLVSDKKEIFTKSKDKNNLLINFTKNDYRILEVKND